jgi:hypothetical protein
LLSSLIITMCTSAVAMLGTQIIIVIFVLFIVVSFSSRFSLDSLSYLTVIQLVFCAGVLVNTDRPTMVLSLSCIAFYAFFRTGGPFPRIF